jgi:hypothetical protein
VSHFLCYDVNTANVDHLVYFGCNLHLQSFSQLESQQNCGDVQIICQISELNLVRSYHF